MEQLQTHILSHLLNNEEYCRRVIPYIKNEYFEGSHKTVFDLIVSFVSKHNKLPTGKVLELELRKINAHEDVLNQASVLITEIANKSDVDGFTDMVRSINGVEVALMIFEQDEISCRINFRSKGNLIINDIANKMGGGGHAYAAGAVVNGTLSEVTSKVVDLTTTLVERKMKGN